MSDQAHIDWAFRQRTGTPALKIALIALAMHADEEGRGSATLLDLAAWAELSDEEAARRTLEALESFNLIRASVAPSGVVHFRLRSEFPGIA